MAPNEPNNNQPKKIRVITNPKLEPTIQNLSPDQLRKMANELRKDAHQLEFRALIMDMDAKPQPRPKRLKWLPPHKVKLN